MSVPDEVIRKKVVQWLAYGDEDLRLVRHGLTMPSGCSYRLIAYHAQQCAEKHLKAAVDEERSKPTEARDRCPSSPASTGA